MNITNKKPFLLTGIVVSAVACGNGGSSPETNSPELPFGKSDTPASASQRKCNDEANKAFTDCMNDETAENSQADCQELARDVNDDCLENEAVAQCEARKSDAVESAARAFTPSAIRWACADVEGVTPVGRDDRGQEYCEYFVAVQLPPEEDGEALGKPLTLGQNQPAGAPTGLDLPDLTDHQIELLEDNEDSIVGQCVFTSWHRDITEAYPACPSDNGNATDCGGLPVLPPAGDDLRPEWAGAENVERRSAETIATIPLTSDELRMKVSFNSNGAAVDLVDKCLGNSTSTSKVPRDGLVDAFMRGCMYTFDLFTTQWRRSDSAICAGVLRLADCGCGVDGDGDGALVTRKFDSQDLDFDNQETVGEGPFDITANDRVPFGFNATAAEIARAVVPNTRRGFPLGTWDDENGLPSGCRFADTGDDSQTLVTCDVTAGDVLSAPELKDFCRATYGNNVVVHVPVPGEAIVCEPSEDKVEECGAMPWIIGDENFGRGEDRVMNLLVMTTTSLLATTVMSLLATTTVQTRTTKAESPARRRISITDGNFRTIIEDTHK